MSSKDKILLQINVRAGKNGKPEASVDIYPSDPATHLLLLGMVAETIKRTIDRQTQPGKEITFRGLN